MVCWRGGVDRARLSVRLATEDGPAGAHPLAAISGVVEDGGASQRGGLEAEAGKRALVRALPNGYGVSVGNSLDGRVG